MSDETKKPIIPEVGMGVTYYVGSDRYAFTITEVVSPTRIKVQEDKVTKWRPFPESEGLEFERNTDAPVKLLSRRKDGTYMEVGRPMCRGIAYVVGHRRAYRDPSF